MTEAPTSLKDELGKRDGFAAPEQEAHLSIVRTAHMLEAAQNRLFKSFGLSMPGYNVLRILRSAGSEGRTCSGIRDDLIAQVPDVTRLLDRLERAGFVERRRSSEDRRVVFAHITEEGDRLLDRLADPVMRLHKELLGHMDREELAQLSRLLFKARHPDSARSPHTDN